ncbi:hypothetical protein LMG28614_02112 [Paraburkholderia ultramafica]|uniref:Uncharacterized protein n=1 Tax=Paraburkholderia ultramafica TaxID=1544867 RepID=A0A6S7BD73_9BURK|nr:hypothetical protein LMG28614_02112 [Paraburkholderia ultramafica]
MLQPLCGKRRWSANSSRKARDSQESPDRRPFPQEDFPAYPNPAPGFAGKTLSKQLWVTFDLNAAR